MTYNNKHQLTVGELKKIIHLIPDDTKLFVGFGCGVEPLRYLCEWENGLMFHPDIYGEDAESFNSNTVLQLLTK